MSILAQYEKTGRGLGSNWEKFVDDITPYLVDLDDFKGIPFRVEHLVDLFDTRDEDNIRPYSNPGYFTRHDTSLYNLAAILAVAAKYNEAKKAYESKPDDIFLQILYFSAMKGMMTIADKGGRYGSNKDVLDYQEFLKDLPSVNEADYKKLSGKFSPEKVKELRDKAEEISDAWKAQVNRYAKDPFARGNKPDPALEKRGMQADELKKFIDAHADSNGNVISYTPTATDIEVVMNEPDFKAFNLPGKRPESIRNYGGEHKSLNAVDALINPDGKKQTPPADTTKPQARRVTKKDNALAPETSMTKDIAQYIIDVLTFAKDSSQTRKITVATNEDAYSIDITVHQTSVRFAGYVHYSETDTFTIYLYRPNDKIVSVLVDQYNQGDEFAATFLRGVDLTDYGYKADKDGKIVPWMNTVKGNLPNDDNRRMYDTHMRDLGIRQNRGWGK